MEVNDFIVKLKADGSEKDRHDLDKVYNEYKGILTKLPTKNKGAFALNVLCILCRNLDKVTSWRDKIDCKELLTLSIDCVRETRGLERPERVKTLACVFHMQKYLVRQPSQLSPELVLKLSYMPFEYDTENLLTEYCKTYWHILADRLVYIEKLKTGRRAIIKLLPKLTEDVQKVIHMYDSVQFCNTVLVFLVKKLHYLFSNEYPKELNLVFGKFFENLSLKTDIKTFKKLTEKEILELYVKFSDIFYVISENSVKLQFKDSCLNSAVRTFISFIGHAPEMFHCLQTFYLNSFCCILTESNNASFDDTVLNSIVISCETTEKLGYFKPMRATYPYINQLLRLYIEFKLSNPGDFTEDTQENCLKLMLILLEKLQNTEQLLKCDNCKIKSGLHDALRLSFLAKSFISTSLNANMNITKIVEPYHIIVTKQHGILTDLRRLGCTNYEKYLRKLQTDIHNTAIILNKAGNFESAIKIFNLYLTHELIHFKTEQDMKNLSRALYNKSICELDSKLYEKALIDAFLSLVFAQPDGLSSEKYMNLVMDIKAKSLKSEVDDDDDLQMVTVFDACCMALERKLYGNLKPFFSNLKFSTLLQHEFTMYGKLWPSIVPIAGVWRSLYNLAKGKQPAWMFAQTDTIDTLYSVIMQTPSLVRTIHNPHYSTIITSLLADGVCDVTAVLKPGDVTQSVVRATLLMLKAEFNVMEAGLKFEWKSKEQNIDPDLVPCTRTLQQEYEALQPALEAVELWTKILPHIEQVSPDHLTATLSILKVGLRRLLHTRYIAHALQLAHTAMRCSVQRGDRVLYLESAGIVLSHSRKSSETLRQAVSLGAERAGRMLAGENMEQALVFICDLAIFYFNTNQPATAARLLRLVQARVLSSQTDGRTELAFGRLLDAQAIIGGLSAKVNAQRHYLTIGNSESNWCARQHRSLLLKHRIASSTMAVVALTRRLRLTRRSRAAAASALGAASATSRVELSAAALDTCRSDTARVIVDQRLKHVIGLPSNEYALQPSENQPSYNTTESKAVPFTPEPKHLETMRDVQILRNSQTSPSIATEYVASYKIPDFYNHDKKCTCYACEVPSCGLLACFIYGLEASVYFRAKEFDIAKNYFDGVLKSFCIVEEKVRTAMQKLIKRNFEKYVVGIVENVYESELFEVELDILIEAAYFELSQKNYSKSDDYIYVRIHEILQVANIDAYMKNEVMNLMTASEILRASRKVDKVQICDIENDFENLKLTPSKEILKTPEIKPIRPPVINKIVVNEEELPHMKCKIPVLKFDEEPEEKVEEKPVKKKINFKIPVPVTSKPIIEEITPRPTRSKVNILVTAPSDEIDINVPVTPKPDSSKAEFFTPESTPDKFFTPLTSVKTYSKKSLRQNIVKNLEEEFSTQKEEVMNKENENKAIKIKEQNKENSSKLELPKRRAKVETGSMRSLKDRLKRSTSPGKMEKDEKVTRSRRLPRPTGTLDKK